VGSPVQVHTAAHPRIQRYSYIPNWESKI